MTERGDFGEEDLLAAEYALGVLDADARRAAQARLERDGRFAADVAEWSSRLAPLAEAVPEEAPPPEVWARVTRELGAGSSTVAANDDAPAVRFWRGLAVGASGLAAASVAAVVVLLTRPEPPGPQIATLATPAGQAAVVVAFHPRTGDLLVTPAGGLQPAGSRPHLWLMEPGGGVRLVGAIDPRRSATHRLPQDLARRARAAEGVAVSLEPPGRTPVEAPNGPVVASGAFSRL
jgi:anti-sigma-K factor RskA